MTSQIYVRDQKDYKVQIHDRFLQSREQERTEKYGGFKRSQGLERKLTGISGVGSGTDNAAKASYQPFSATHGPGGGFDTGGEDMNPEVRIKVDNIH